MIFHKDKIAYLNEKTMFFYEKTIYFANPTRTVVKERTNEHKTDRPPAFFRHEELERVRRFVSGTTEGVMNSLPPTQT